MLSWTSSRRHSLRLPQSLLSQIQFFLNFHSHPPKNSSFSARSSKPSPCPDRDYPKSESKSLIHNHLFQKPSTIANTFDFDENTVLETLSCYSNDWKRALEFFNWVETECEFQHSTETYNRTIDILGKFFEFDLAWNLIEEMAKNARSIPNHNTFGALFNRYASAHLVDEAIRAYHRTGEFNLKDELSFLNLIDALCERKHVIEAEEMCLGKKNDKDLHLYVNTKVYNIILRGWCKMGWWSKCREFWEEMDRMGIQKDVYSYSIYMDIQCKRRKPCNAVKLYKEMKNKGIKLDVVAYNTVLHAMGRSNGVDFAIRVSLEMKELGCEPNVVTYNTIIKLFCEHGRVREAYKVLGQMRAKGCAPNVLTYHSLFGYLEKPREILKLFDNMMAGGVRPRMDTYVMLMRKFGRWGFLRPVLVVWEKMKEHGLSPNEHAYNALIDALVQKGLVDMARKYDQEMLARGLSAKPRAELGTKLLSEGTDG